MNPSHETIFGWLTLALLAFAVDSATTATAGSAATPEFEEGKSGITTIALLPPHATMSVIKVGADEALIVESAELEKHGSDLSLQYLEGLGYEVRRFTSEQINADPELRELVLRANERFEESHDKMLQRPRKVKKRRYNLGEESQLLAGHLGVDALAFQRINVAGAAAGQMAVALLFGASSGGAFFDIVIVDARTGDVEGFYYDVRGLVGKEKASKPEELVTDMMQAAFKKFPKAATDVSRPDRASDISELEALLEPGEKED